MGSIRLVGGCILLVFCSLIMISGGEEHLHMIANDDLVTCVANGEAANSAIAWRNLSTARYKSSAPVLAGQHSTECPESPAIGCWSLSDLGNWSIESSLNWDLPPLDFYHWHRLPAWTTSGAETLGGRVNVPESSWTLVVSVLTTAQADVFLCSDTEDPHTCYWLAVNEQQGRSLGSSMRRCTEVDPDRGIVRGCDELQVSSKFQGEVGEPGLWLHLQLHWDESRGHFRVASRSDDLTFTNLLLVNLPTERVIDISYLTFRTKRLPGDWKAHVYDFLALNRTNIQSNALQTVHYKPAGEPTCWSFYYFLGSGSQLTVFLTTARGTTQKLGVLTKDNLTTRWHRAQFVVEEREVSTRFRIQVVPTVEQASGDARSSMFAIILDKVEICPGAEVFQLSLTVPLVALSLGSQFECYLLDQPKLRVKFNAANSNASASFPSTAVGRRLCALSAAACGDAVFCDSQACACAPGHTTPFCRQVTEPTHHLFLFAREGSVQCVANGSAATGVILWSNMSSSLSSSGFVFESFFPNQCLQTQTNNFCQWPWKSVGGWTVQSSLAWSLPPLNYFRWEKLQPLTTSPGPSGAALVDMEDLGLPVAQSWRLDVSVTSEGDFFVIELCETPRSQRIMLCNLDLRVLHTSDVLDFYIHSNQNNNNSNNNNNNLGRAVGTLLSLYPGLVGINDIRNNKSRPVPSSEWIHLRLDWDQQEKRLVVFCRMSDLAYEQVATKGINWPISIRSLQLSTQGTGEWRLHNYEVLGLLTSTPDTETVLKTDWYQPRAFAHCISIFYYIFPGHSLHMSMLVEGQDDIPLGVLTSNSSQENDFIWKEAQFTLDHPTFTSNKEILYDFQVKGVFGSRVGDKPQLAAVIDSVRECDPQGDIRISTIKNPGFISNSSQFECYLLSAPEKKVRLFQADIGASAGQEALKGSALCSRANQGQPCKATVVCSHGQCACSSGYLGPLCREECGWAEYRNTYGPGCSEICGNCTETRRNNTKICHHQTGGCFTNSCLGDLIPPLCKFSRRDVMIGSTTVKPPEKEDFMTVTILVTIGALVIATVMLLLLIVVLVNKKRQERKLRDELRLVFEGGVVDINPQLPLYEQADLLPYSKRWEFPRDKLKLGEQLGSGAFGVVMRGEAVCIRSGEAITTVAVKMVKRHAGLEHVKALASEMKIMAHLGQHLNVVNFLGACTKNLDKRDLFVIVEYCRYGNLHSYLMRHREDFINQVHPETGQIDTKIGSEYIKKMRDDMRLQKLQLLSGNREMSVLYENSAATVQRDATPLLTGLQSVAQKNTTVAHVELEPPVSSKDLLSWAFQVARGMEYLACRKVLHGDLAARNILLADDGVVKICDFGLSRTVYTSSNYLKQGNEKLPLKWMAIESIRDRIFSTQSDVWAYGIVLWEFFSLAQNPYPGIEAYDELYSRLLRGFRMECPKFATKNVHKVMLRCWEAEPQDRPTFTELIDLVGDMLEESVRAFYIDMNACYVTMNRTSEVAPVSGEYRDGGPASSSVQPPQEVENIVRIPPPPRGGVAKKLSRLLEPFYIKL